MRNNNQIIKCKSCKIINKKYLMKIVNIINKLKCYKNNYNLIMTIQIKSITMQMNSKI